MPDRQKGLRYEWDARDDNDLEWYFDEYRAHLAGKDGVPQRVRRTEVKRTVQALREQAFQAILSMSKGKLDKRYRIAMRDTRKQTRIGIASNTGSGLVFLRPLLRKDGIADVEVRLITATSITTTTVRG